LTLGPPPKSLGARPEALVPPPDDVGEPLESPAPPLGAGVELGGPLFCGVAWPEAASPRRVAADTDDERER